MDTGITETKDWMVAYGYCAGKLHEFFAIHQSAKVLYAIVITNQLLFVWPGIFYIGLCYAK